VPFQQNDGHAKNEVIDRERHKHALLTDAETTERSKAVSDACMEKRDVVPACGNKNAGMLPQAPDIFEENLLGGTAVRLMKTSPMTSTFLAEG
jgi:hypothetical protein